MLPEKYTLVKDGKCSLYVTCLCCFRPADMSLSRTPSPPCHLSSVIKVSSFGVSPPPPKGDDVIYVQPLTADRLGVVLYLCLY